MKAIFLRILLKLVFSRPKTAPLPGTIVERGFNMTSTLCSRMQIFRKIKSKLTSFDHFPTNSSTCWGWNPETQGLNWRVDISSWELSSLIIALLLSRDRFSTNRSPWLVFEVYLKQTDKSISYIPHKWGWEPGISNLSVSFTTHLQVHSKKIGTEHFMKRQNTWCSFRYQKAQISSLSSSDLKLSNLKPSQLWSSRGSNQYWKISKYSQFD